MRRNRRGAVTLPDSAGGRANTDPNLHINGTTCNNIAFARGSAIMHDNGLVAFSSLRLQDVSSWSRNEQVRCGQRLHSWTSS